MLDRYNIVNEADLREPAVKMSRRDEQVKGDELATLEPKAPEVAKPTMFH